MSTYAINGVPLDDDEGRWCLEAATRSPAPSGIEVATVTSPGVHGARLAGNRSRLPATLALSIAVMGKTHAEMRENWQTLLLVLSGWRTEGVLEIEYDDGDTITMNRGVISSDMIPDEYGPTALVLPLTVTIPDPFWEETTINTLKPANREPTLWGALAGGSAPVHPLVHVRGTSPVTGVAVTCLETGRVATWSGSTTELWWQGWKVRRSRAGESDRALAFGVESEPVVYPSIDGDYRVKVEVAGGGQNPVIDLVGARRFQ